MKYWDESLASILRPLKHCCHLNPAVLPETTDPDWEFDYIDIGSVSLSEGVTHKERMRFAASPSRARKSVREGDILVSTVRTYLKAIAAIEQADTPQVASTGFAVLRANKGTDARFLYRVVQSSPFVEQVVSQSTGVSYPAINPSTLSNIEVPLPDLATQRQIADFLDRETARIDLLIEKKKRLVVLLGERFEATVSHLTSPPNQDAAGWIERPIKAICSIFGRIGFRGYTTEDIVDEGDGAVTLSPSNLKDGRMTLEGRTYLSWRKYKESPEIQISLGDIVFVKTGSTIGKVAKVDELPEPMTLNPQLVVLKKVTVDRDFLLFAMQSRAFQYQVSFNRFGGSTPAMSQGHLGRLRVWLPDGLEEQRQRAESIIRERESVGAIKTSLNKSIERLKEYRAALITAAVTGQIDVATYAKSGTPDCRLDAIQEEMDA